MTGRKRRVLATFALGSSLACAPASAADGALRLPAPGGEVVLLGEQEKRHYEQFHFSAVRRAGDTLYLSGVVVYPTGNDSDFSSATRAVFRNIEDQLRASGSDLAHVVALQTFHVWNSPLGGGTKNRQFEAFAAVKDEFLKAPYPAWTAVGVTELLPDQGVVEIQVTAVVAKGGEGSD